MKFYFNFSVIAQRLKQRKYMVSGIFGPEVWGHFGSHRVIKEHNNHYTQR